MKVLERKDWSHWRHRCDCPQCKAKLEAEPKDIVCNPSSGGNQHDYCPEYFYVVCPDCNQQISVADNQIPAYLQKLARDRSQSRGYRSSYPGG